MFKEDLKEGERSMSLLKRTFAVLAMMFMPAFAMAAPIPVSELSAYLNRLNTATADFQQVSHTGNRDSGKLYVQRPYRMRFEYSKQPLLVLASAGQVAVFDDKTSGGPQQYPMSKTPLSLILAPNIDLEKQGIIVGYGEVGGRTIVTLKDPTGQTPGSIEVMFDQGPVLAGWVATDEIGNRTVVTLTGLRSGVSFKPSTFAIESEVARRERAR